MPPVYVCLLCGHMMDQPQHHACEQPECDIFTTPKIHYDFCRKCRGKTLKAAKANVASTDADRST